MMLIREAPPESGIVLGTLPKLSLSLFTIGYSVRSLKTVLNMLIPHEIEQIIDVRYNVWSRNPDFNGKDKKLRVAFAGFGIEYKHIQKLGNPPVIRHLFSKNRTEWRYLFFNQFTNEEKELYQKIVLRKPTVLMCSENRHSKCHRTEIARWLCENLPSQVKVIHL